MSKRKHRRKRGAVVTQNDPAFEASRAKGLDDGGQNVAKHEARTNPNNSEQLKATTGKTAMRWNGLRSSPVWGIIYFVAGTISGLVIQQSFVALLPAPKVSSFLRSERMTKPGSSACNFYLFSFVPQDPIDYMYVKLQFPNPITSFNVGVPQETVILDTERAHNLSWGKGWDANGACAVIDANLVKNSDIQSSSAGNMIGIHASKLPFGTRIIGLIATTDRQSTVEPISSTIWTEGEYEYSKLGKTIRKKIPIEIHIVTSPK